MKPIEFLGRSLESIRSFPATAKREAGYQLDRVQRGLIPSDWKPMKSVGNGVREIRVQSEGQHRVVYIAAYEDAVYVLHAFQKKSRQTSRQDLEMARANLKTLKRRYSK